MGKWGIVDAGPLYPTWPVVDIWVAAHEKVGSPDKYYFRFNLSGYPSTAPTACPWNIATNQKLAFDKWPKGGLLVSSVFRIEWFNRNALYAPCDRGADLPGHSNWAQQHAEYYWQSTFTIHKYLRFLYEILHTGDYIYG